jgi:hypothetical protein
MLRLVSTDSRDGTQIILDELFGKDLGETQSPSKSALSQFRNSVSFTFFQHGYEKMSAALLHSLPRWNGFRFLGLDGDVYSLPRSKDLLANGFRGHALSDDRETHCLKMYTLTATDLISNAPIAFEYSNSSDEISLAVKIIAKTTTTDICVYDRLFESKKLIEAHKTAGSYFVFRLKSAGNFKVIDEFLQSDQDSSVVSICGVAIRLIKTWITEKDEPIAIATNVPESSLNDHQAGEIYTRRWASETSNRDTTANNALDTFHSRDLNKILQEIYACLILRTITAAVISEQQDLASDFLTREYSRPNFKETLRFIAKMIHKFFSKGREAIVNFLCNIIRRSNEKRKRRSRSSPRELRYKRTKDFPKKTARKTK